MKDDLLAVMRQQMVEIIGVHAVHAQEQTGKETLAPRILDAMGCVPRHEFVPVELIAYAYSDQPLPIGHSKTISQPFIVALMTDLLDIQQANPFRIRAYRNAARIVAAMAREVRAMVTLGEDLTELPGIGAVAVKVRHPGIEAALRADFALINARRADHIGNLTYAMTARNFNPNMATAGKTTVVEVEEFVPEGALDPDAVHTPGIYVDRIVLSTINEKRIEKLTTRPREEALS